MEKYYKTRSQFLRKNQHFSVKSTFLLKKLLKSWFHEIFLSVIGIYSTFPHCAKEITNEMFWRNILIWEIFREINFYQKVASLRFTDFLLTKHVHTYVHTAQFKIWKFFLPRFFFKNFVKVTFLLELYCKLISRNFFQVGVNFRHYRTVYCTETIVNTFHWFQQWDNFVISWFHVKS